MGEAEEIKRKKLEELQRKQQQTEEDQSNQQVQDLQKLAVLRALLTSGAKERLTRVKMGHPDLGAQVENLLIQLAQQGRIKQKVDENTLLNLLRQVQGQKKDFKIHRI